MNNKLYEILDYLEKKIEERKNSDQNTYTSKLLKKDIDRISQKFGEEAVELVIAANGRNRNQIINESADLLFHLMVLWNKLDIEGNEVAEELIKRKK
ncbi:MAG: phosphoribosyl-ATP diphosphatase [Rickettsiales bacterium]|nr:phosphoribosyl-ATP diphosphatase [Rickettsiales bacterium]